MNKVIDWAANIAAALYFIFPMSIMLFLMIIMPAMFLSDVSSITESGFAGPDRSISFIAVVGLFLGLSLTVPAFRRMYKALPWMYSFVKIFFVNLIILNIGSLILNTGYQVNNSSRHNLFFILMIIQIIVCRAAMCIYFKFKPVEHIKER